MKTVYLLLLLCVSLVACSEEKIVVPAHFVQESFWLRNQGADLYVTARGNQDAGPLIINVHGGPAVGAQYIALSRPSVYQHLEEQGIVIYYDQRGIGLSSGHFAESTLTLEQFVDDLDQVIAVVRHQYGAEKSIFLLSRSWGGLLTAEYLLDEERQDQIAGWISVSGAYDLPLIRTYGKSRLQDVAQEQIGLGHSPEGWQAIRDFADSFDPTDHSFDNLNALWTQSLEGMQLLEDDGLLQEVEETTGLSPEQISSQTAYSSLEVSQNDAQGISDIILSGLMDYSPDLSRIVVPSLFIAGYYDLLVPADLAETAYAGLGTADEDKYRRIYPNQAHLPMKAPELFNVDAEQFIEAYK